MCASMYAYVCGAHTHPHPYPFPNTLMKGTLPDEWKLAEVKALFKKEIIINQRTTDQ